MSDRNAERGWLIVVRVRETSLCEIFAVAIDEHDLAIERLRAKKELPDRAVIVAAAAMYPEMPKDLNMREGDILLLDSLRS
jgi:hypothetical protein